MQCQNSGRRAGTPVVSPQCHNGDAEKSVTITYSEVEEDTLLLCKDCAEAVREAAERHGYIVEVSDLA